jgi:centromeric protein E
LLTALGQLFDIARHSPGKEFLFKVSYFEIYNEEINDLLDPVKTKLRVHTTSKACFTNNHMGVSLVAVA